MQAQDNTFVLKHRIVGAAILISFGALFLPWLLGNPKSAVSEKAAVQDIFTENLQNQAQTEINDKEVEDQIQVYVSKITPLIDPVSTNKKLEEEKSKPVANKSKPIAKPKEKKEPVSGQVKQEVVTKPKEEKPKPNKNVELGWIVSVGVFSKKNNVDAVVADLKSKGFKPSTSKTDTSKGPATRVWLGPYEQRVDAAKARTNLKQLTGEPGLIVAYP